MLNVNKMLQSDLCQNKLTSYYILKKILYIKKVYLIYSTSTRSTYLICILIDFLKAYIKYSTNDDINLEKI